MCPFVTLNLMLTTIQLQIDFDAHQLNNLRQVQWIVGFGDVKSFHPHLCLCTLTNKDSLKALCQQFEKPVS